MTWWPLCRAWAEGGPHKETASPWAAALPCAEKQQGEQLPEALAPALPEAGTTLALPHQTNQCICLCLLLKLV